MFSEVQAISTGLEQVYAHTYCSLDCKNEDLADMISDAIEIEQQINSAQVNDAVKVVSDFHLRLRQQQQANTETED